MKKVLITGANSYIGKNFGNWVKDNTDDITVDYCEMRSGVWKEKDFSTYDTIFHVAGIAHADVGKVSEEQKAMYYKVNSELTAQCAGKAKAEGVKQFIFMSSIIVYGESAGIGKDYLITKDTPVNPANFYGDSKVKAEEALSQLRDENFKVAILRPPMIYGKGSKGNYPLLAKMARKFPFFPDICNQRSMLYVGNLCKFVSLLIKNQEDGLFFPQNAQYVKTTDMVQAIGKIHSKRIRKVKIFNPLLRLFGKFGGKIGGLVNKAFGNMVYEQTLSIYKEEYRIYDFDKSIELTEQ